MIIRSSFVRFVARLLIIPPVAERASRYDSSFPFQMELRRRSLNVLCPKMFKHIIRDLSVSLILRRLAFSSTAFLSHLPPPSEYVSLPPLARFMFLSLANWSLEVRSDVLADPLWQSSLSTPNLGDWCASRMTYNDQLLVITDASIHRMFSCSDADEQVYVNSCEPAASNTGLVAHASHPIILFAAAQRVVSHIRERRLPYLSKTERAYFCMWPFTSPSVYNYNKIIIDKACAMFAAARSTSTISSFLLNSSLTKCLSP